MLVVNTAHRPNTWDSAGTEFPRRDACNALIPTDARGGSFSCSQVAFVTGKDSSAAPRTRAWNCKPVFRPTQECGRGTTKHRCSHMYRTGNFAK